MIYQSSYPKKIKIVYQRYQPNPTTTFNIENLWLFGKSSNRINKQTKYTHTHNNRLREKVQIILQKKETSSLFIRILQNTFFCLLTFAKNCIFLHKNKSKAYLSINIFNLWYIFHCYCYCCCCLFVLLLQLLLFSKYNLGNILQ